MSYAATWARNVVLDILINGVYVLAILWTFNHCMEKSAINFTASHRYSLYLSLAAVGLLALFWALQRFGLMGWPWRRVRESWKLVPLKAAYTGLICATLFGVFNYFKFDEKHLTEVNDYLHVTHHYLNAKYYPELGYFDLYAALLIADEEGTGQLGNVRRIRDLRTHQLIAREDVLQPDAVEAVKAQFTPERWETFTHDAAYLTSQYRNLDTLLIDRGYNAPATWTAYGGLLSAWAPIEQVKTITSLDTVLIVIMFGFIYRAFGITACLFALFWFSVTFSGRWPILGQAMLRFDWLAALVIGVCLLKMRWHAAAGAALALSVLSRVFPAIFLFPYAVVLLRDVVRERRISGPHRRFLAGFVGFTVLLTGVTLARLGPEAFTETVENLRVHQDTYSMHRAGLGVAAVYRGETTVEDLEGNGGIEGKREEILALKPQLYGVTLALMALIGWYIVRTGAPAHAVIHLAILPLFGLTMLQSGYYTLRVLPAMIHASNLRQHRNKFLLGVLFLVETLTQAVMISGVPRYTVTSWMSYGLFLYLGCLAATMCYEIMHPGQLHGAASTGGTGRGAAQGAATPVTQPSGATRAPAAQ